MTPDIAQAIRANAIVIGGLSDEYQHCHNDSEGYAFRFGLTKPHGITYTQWGEEQCAVLASDITVRCEQLMRLVEPGRVA